MLDIAMLEEFKALTIRERRLTDQSLAYSPLSHPYRFPEDLTRKYPLPLGGGFTRYSITTGAPSADESRKVSRVGGVKSTMAEILEQAAASTRGNTHIAGVKASAKRSAPGSADNVRPSGSAAQPAEEQKEAVGSCKDYWCWVNCTKEECQSDHDKLNIGQAIQHKESASIYHEGTLP